MRNNRVKIILALILTVAVMICSTVSVFAYNPIVTIKSSDWNCEEGATAYDYPDKILIGDDEDAFRQYTELYGDTCYFSSTDDMVTLNSVDVEINPDDYKYDGFYFFEHNNRLYLVNFNPDAVLMCLDSVGCLSFYPRHGDDESAENQTTTLSIYYSNYPYNKFKSGTSYNFSSAPSDSEYEIGQWLQHFTARYLYPDYSTVDVYGRDDIDISGVVYEADEPITDTFTFKVELTEPYKIYTGIASFSLTATQIQQFSLGRYAFLFNNLGFINGYDSLYDGVYFQMNIYNDDHSVYESFPLLDKVLWDAVGMTGQTSTLSAYSCSIDDYVIFWENDFDDLNTGVYNCVIAFVFVSDVYSAFFPGTVEIVEFENYEDDVEHEELIDKITDSTSAINKEIGAAVEDITGSIESSVQLIISGETGVVEVEIDTSDLDNITVEQDKILEEEYSKLNSSINEYLPKGYKDPYEYLNDSISDFSSINSAFEFIKTMYDRTVEATGMGSVILFCLAFGFATYAIGRRLS